MMKRLVDVCMAGCFLVLVSPLLLLGIVGVKLASSGPVFYRAKRIGRDEIAFDMLKLRSMHVSDGGPVITAHGDPRIFAFGRFIRQTKIDEIPQLINVLRGEMSLVGTRPEDPMIIKDAYRPWMKETLTQRPGLTSLGSVYYYLYGEDAIDPDDPEGSYVDQLLPIKLAIDVMYQRGANPLKDFVVITKTVWAVVAAGSGLRAPQIEPYLTDARAFLSERG